jgi:FKBP-type peptidyl-prolyl cis-trans isomerase
MGIGRFMSAQEVASTTEADAFESYAPATESQQLVSKDLLSRTGDGAKDGDILAVEYEGRLMATGKRFDKGEFSSKLGSGRVMPG